MLVHGTGEVEFHRALLFYTVVLVMYGWCPSVCLCLFECITAMECRCMNASGNGRTTFSVS
jgi:hypothetical protein